MADSIPDPLVKTALGAAWHRLAEPVRRHYTVSTDKPVRLQGVMRVNYPLRVLPLIVAARLCGALVHRRGENIAVTVDNRADNTKLLWHRTFRFSRHTVIFQSRMEYLAGNEIIEYVRFGLGIRLRLSEQDGALVFHSNGYWWRIGPWCLSLPDWLLLGRAEIIERAEAVETVVLTFRITHPWWGDTYDYSGRFVPDEV